MTLAWVRLETGLPDHPKMLSLIAGKKQKAALAYVFGLAYCGRHELDGFIPASALPVIHATKADAMALCEIGFWHARPGGYEINDWAEYQPTNESTRMKRELLAKESAHANCVRWHGKECGCWKEKDQKPIP